MRSPCMHFLINAELIFLEFEKILAEKKMLGDVKI